MYICYYFFNSRSEKPTSFSFENTFQNVMLIFKYFSQEFLSQKPCKEGGCCIVQVALEKELGRKFNQTTFQ